MDGLVRCGGCGFDRTAWRVRDAASLLDALGTWWRLALDGIEPVVLAARPLPSVPSALEQASHSASVVADVRTGLERAWADGTRLRPLPGHDGAAPVGNPGGLDADDVVEHVADEGSQLAALARSTPADAWAQEVVVGDAAVQADEVLLHAVHATSHRLMDVAAALAAAGAGTPRQEGRVRSLNVSAGGVPKLPVAGADVTWSGVVGDRQKERAHHGRPFQALCLWSTEVIGELAAAGHDLQPGAAGENVTIAGLDWPTLRPGSRLRIGTVLAEVSFPTVPCAKQARWFSDGDVRRIAHERNPQWVRWYAWVREPGAVQPGDAVTVQP